MEAGALNHMRAVVLERPTLLFNSAGMAVEWEYSDDFDFVGLLTRSSKLSKGSHLNVIKSLESGTFKSMKPRLSSCISAWLVRGSLMTTVHLSLKMNPGGSVRVLGR